MISCYTESQAYVNAQIYNKMKKAFHNFKNGHGKNLDSLSDEDILICIFLFPELSYANFCVKLRRSILRRVAIW